MFRRARKVRIYVRNKQRYDPASKTRGFLFVDVDDFVGTTIADIKEDIRKQTKGAVRIDELFLNNLPLADDRSVAHYNLQHETILETTSNPFWVSCLYIKVAEVKQEQEGHPNNQDIQNWTTKSIPKKYTLIGILLNSKKEKFKQPPHFPTLDDFLLYLESLNNKKGASMHPDYTQKDMRAFEREYRQDFLGRYDDPLSVFLDHHALRLGYLEPEDIDQPVRIVDVPPLNEIGNNRVPQNNGHQKQGRLCEDCEMVVASLYCTDCPGGIALCEPCSDRLHAGVKRRRHNLQDIKQAPKNNKPYVPRAFLAPFALTVAMYRCLTEGKLSLTEEEIKKKAQPLTDTDLMDKQNGRYVGGFDCMENMLIAKGLVKKEAARIPTYALTESGHILGEKLYTFYVTFNSFLHQHNFPKINYSFLNQIAGNRKICLIIDEHERHKDRLLSFAADKHIDAQVRFLPAGDYVWILSPPMFDVTERYMGNDPANEMVLPFVVERKSWEDYENTLNSSRYQRQINNMLGSGLKYCYYLMEGSLSALKTNKSQHHQQHLKAQVEKLITEYGFYVNYTSSWMKTAQWILWFSQLLIKGCNMGLFKDDYISYSDYTSRVARQTGPSRLCVTFRNAEKCYHKWTGQLFIDHIFRDSQGGQSMINTVRQELNITSRKKHLLVIQDLEQYNKKRQQILTKCCEMVCSNTLNAREIVSDKIGLTIHNMVHYDISSFWQLNIQIILGVYVVRTENDEDSTKIQNKFLTGPQGPIPTLSPSSAKKGVLPKKMTKGKDKHQSDILLANILREIQPNQTNNTVLPVTDSSYYLDRTTHSRLDGSSMPTRTSSDNSANFSKVPGSRKSNIHTFSSTESTIHADNCSYDTKNKSSGLYENSVNKGTPKSKVCSGVPLYMVTPFTGEGHCLGSRTDSNSNHIVDNKPALPGTLRSEDYQGGLLGGANDTVDSDLTDLCIKTEDFVSPQEEEDVLRKIMLKSQADVTVNNTNNEDEMVRLAVELSKRDTQTVDSTGVDTENHEMSLALERSITDSFVSTDTHEPTGDAELEMALERSMVDYTRNTFTSDSNRGNRSLPPEDELEMVIERSKLELPNKPHVKSCTSVTDSNKPRLNKNFSGKIGTSSQEKLYGVEYSEEKSKVNRGVKRNVSDASESEEKIGTVKIDSEMSEQDELKIVLELSKKDTFKAASQQPSIELLKEETELGNTDVDDVQLILAIERSKVENYSPRKRFKSGNQNSANAKYDSFDNKNVNLYCKDESKESVEVLSCKQSNTVLLEGNSDQENSIEPTSLDVEDKQLKLAIERSKVGNYSPRKKFKSGNENDAYMRTVSVDNKNHAAAKESVEVILIESQSQELKCEEDTDSVILVPLDDSETKTCHETEELKKITGNLFSTEKDLICQPSDINGAIDITQRCKLITDKDHELKPSRDTHCVAVDVHNFFSNNHFINTLQKREYKYQGSSIHIANGENNSDDSDDDCVLPSPDKISGPGSFFTPPISQRRRSLFNLSSQNSTSKVVNKVSDKITKENVKSSPESSLAETDKVVSDNENPRDSIKVPKKSNLLSQVFYDSSESDCDSSDDDNDDNDENKVIDGSKGVFCSPQEIDKVNGRILIPGNICITSSCQERGKSSLKKEPNTIDVSENMPLLNRKKECGAINDHENEEIHDEADNLKGFDVDMNDRVEVNKIKVESVFDDYDRFPACRKDQDQPSDQVMDNNTLSDHSIEHKILRKHSNDNETLPDQIDNDTLDDHVNDHEPLSEYDDDMLDIDFQPNSQDYNTESSGTPDNDSEPDLEPDHDDGETLPVIGRPRIVKYKIVRGEIDRLVKEKQNKEFKYCYKETKCSILNIKTEKESDHESDENTKSNTVDMDEQIARLMQSQFDSELNDVNTNLSKERDAEYARKLQDRLNCEKTSIKREGSTSKNMSNTTDEAYAKQLDLVLNGEKGHSETLTNQYKLVQHGGGIHSRVQTNPGHVYTQYNLTNTPGIVCTRTHPSTNREREIEELQRRELEKIERWKKAILDDEKLARQIQQLEEMEKQQTGLDV